MPSFKHKFSGKEYAQAERALRGLVGFIPKTEQYCKLRLDGQAPVASGNVILKLYTNGTLLIQAGSDAAIQWALSQLPASLGLASQPANNMEHAVYKGGLPSSLAQASLTPYIGTDESGKGDYFGPLVVCGVVIPDEETATQLRQLGVRDGKTITDAQIGQLATQIGQLLPEDAIALWVRPPEAYNAAIEKAKAHNQTLNHVLACGHGTVIAQLMRHYPAIQLALVDQFANNTSLVTKAAAHAGAPNTVQIVQETKAESHLAVAAASIVARATFLQELHTLGEPLGLRLPKGAGSPVNAMARKIIASHGAETLKTLVKWHFKTTQTVLY